MSCSDKSRSQPCVPSRKEKQPVTQAATIKSAKSASELVRIALLAAAPTATAATAPTAAPAATPAIAPAATPATTSQQPTSSQPTAA